MIRRLFYVSICTVICISSPTSFAKTADAIPAILCLLLCEDAETTTPPALQDISGTVSLISGELENGILFTNSGGKEIDTCGTNPPLPAGLNIHASGSGSSCVISGTPLSEQATAVFTITATNIFGNSSATVSLEILPSEITITGTVTYDLIPTTNVGGVRLDYDNISQEPVRGATVQLLDDGNALLQSTVTNQSGEYSFTLAEEASVRIRARAELLKTEGDGRYNVRIEDNTNSNALYTLAETSASSARLNPDRNLNAASGWDGTSYTSTRASGPFAMLDSIFSAISDVLQIDATAVFPLLTVNWSVDNRPVGGDMTNGEIGTSFYTNGNLFILGAANSDTDEFDDHIIIHEWGHYFEDKLSRSDSIGGPHSGGDRLDMRVAFGEGFGNALSGMITDDPLYIDTSGSSQASGFTINVESNPTFNKGWYNESSIQSILYDLYDSDDDGADAISLGLGPIYDVLVNEQRNSPFYTSIFTFVTALKENNLDSIALIDQLVSSQSIVSSTIDSQGSTETNNAGGAQHVLPVYSDLVAGSSVNICTNTPFNGSSSNKLANHRYLTFDIATAGNYAITMTRTFASDGYGNSDPDFEVQQNGASRVRAISGVDNVESTSVFLSTGTHVMAATDFAIRSPGARGVACFNILISLDPPN